MTQSNEQSNKPDDDLREALANLCHEQWSDWMSYLFTKGMEMSDGSFIIWSPLVARWQRQMETPYSQLSDAEQDSDRKEADKFLALLRSHEDGAV